jgi:hypothetical protein
VEWKLLAHIDPHAKLMPPQAIALLIASAIPSVVKILFYPDYPGADDVFMHLSVLQNLSHGLGWGINANDPVNVSTSPAFTILFYLVSLVSNNVLLSGMMISMIVTTTSLFALYFIAYRITREFGISLFCVLLAATNIQLWRWNGTFIESSLAFCFVIWAVYFYSFVIEGKPATWKRNYFIFGLLLGFGVLLRPELGMLGCIFFANDLLGSRRGILSRYVFCGVGFVLVIGCYAAWALSYFGQILPTTFYAKADAGLNLLNLNVAKQIGLLVLSGALGSILATGVLMFLPLRPGAPSLTHVLRSSFIFWAIPLSGFLFYYLKVGSVFQSPARYYLPFMATLPLIPLGLAWDRIAQRTMLTIVGSASLCQLFVAAYLNYTVVTPVLTRMWSEYISTQFEAADLINQICERGQTVLVYYDIGSFSYRLDKKCRVADGDGLATPVVRRLPIAAAIAATNASFVIESLGTSQRIIQHRLSDGGVPATLIWSRSFKSLGTLTEDTTYETRIYRLGNRKIENQNSSSDRITNDLTAPFATTAEQPSSGFSALFPWASGLRSR